MNHGRIVWVCDREGIAKGKISSLAATVIQEHAGVCDHHARMLPVAAMPGAYPITLQVHAPRLGVMRS